MNKITALICQSVINETKTGQVHNRSQVVKCSKYSLKSRIKYTQACLP